MRITPCETHKWAEGHEARPTRSDKLGWLSCEFEEPRPRNNGAEVGGLSCPRCRWEGQPLAVWLPLPMLPDAKRLGGNARVHHQERARVFKAEKEAWWAHVRSFLLPPYPKFRKARAKVTLVFPDRRKRDLQDNFAVALKPLWDALVDQGVLEGDDAGHLTVEPLEEKVDKDIAPRTELQLIEEAEMETKAEYNLGHGVKMRVDEAATVAGVSVVAETPALGSVQWWGDLALALNQARRVLWDRVQAGYWDDLAQADAAVNAVKALDKALKLIDQELRQAPMPLDNRG